MEPIITFHERRFDCSRTFELFVDAVVVKGATMIGTEFQARFPLASLDPHPQTFRCRSRHFWTGVWVIAIPLVVREALVGPLHMPWTATLPVLTLLVSLYGLLICVATFRRVEIVQFTTQAGIATLNVARAGSEADRFDAFVEAIVGQIRKAAAGD